MSVSYCPNCNAQIKESGWSVNLLFDEKRIMAINKYSDNPSTAYCNKCGDNLYYQLKNKIECEINVLNDKLINLLENIVVLTTHTPLNWDYQAIGIVTGQSTTGTGVLAEFTSEFTDFFGVQSNAYNKKLAIGENICLGQLRMKAIALGANAIIATDIDYSEVGGLKGMLMVCAAGTAVNLTNPEILGPEKEKNLSETKQLVDKLKTLKADLGT